MGRQERPLDPNGGPAEQFAAGLRELRRNAGGITYRAMAARANYSTAALAQAASGERMPTLAVTLAYVQACGGDQAEWTSRWEKASEAVIEQAAADSDPGQAPYLGLTRFEPGDRDLFFGRERLTAHLAAAVRRQPLTAIVGPSGSGKSSLLRAGLIPALREEAPAHRPTAIRILRPGPHPARTHAELLAPDNTGQGTVVVVDQFEETFTLCTDPAERAAFIDLLLAATTAGRGVRVVLAVRADFFSHCAAHRPLAEALQDATQLIPPMNPDELREVIVRPAAARGLTVERTLTTRLIREVSEEPGSLPLLSHALLETWHRRHGRTLTQAAHDAAGGIRGAVARTAEDLYATLTPEQATAARSILLRLVTPGDGTEDVRRPAGRAEFDDGSGGGEARGQVLERLARARLVTLTESTVDLAHEALLTAWPRLRGWIDEDRERIRRHRRLTEAAASWDALAREAGALYQGTRLSAAEECFPAQGGQDDLTALEREFLTRSTAARQRRQRRRRVLTLVFSLVVALALTAGLLAWQQNRAGERRRIESEANRIAAVAESLRTSDPVTAMRLSLAAWRLADLPDTRSALLAAMVQSDLDLYTDTQGGPGTLRHLSRDGRTLLTLGADGVFTTSLDTGEHGVAGPGLGAAAKNTGVLRADSSFVPYHSQDRSIGLWNLATGSLEPLEGPVKGGAELGADGRHIVVYDNTGDRYVMRVRDATDRGTVLELSVPRDPATPDQGTYQWSRPFLGWSRLREHRAGDGRAPDMEISPDGRTAALCAGDSPLQLWDLPGRRRLDLAWVPVPTAQQCFEERVSFSPDGRQLVLVTSDAVRRWDLATGSELAPVKAGEVQEVAFSADGAFIATSTFQSFSVWRSDTSQSVFGYMQPGEAITDLRIDPAAGWVRYLSGSELEQGSSVRTVDIRTGLGVTKGDTESVAGQFSPDGSLLASAAWSAADRAVHITVRDGLSGKVLYELPAEPCADECFPYLRFSPDGTFLAHGAADRSDLRRSRTVRLWDVAQRRVGRSLEADDTVGEGSIAAVGPAGQWVVLSDNTFRGNSVYWDLRNGGTVTRALTGVTGVPVASPDGRRLVTSDGHVVDLPGGIQTPPLPGPGQVAVVEFSPDGNVVAAADDSGRVVLWDRTLTRRLGTLVAETGQVTALAFSRDGRTLATGGVGGGVQLWNLTTNRPLGLSLSAGRDYVSALSFAPDGSTLQVSTRHIPFQRFEIGTPTAVTTVCGRARGGLSPEQWKERLPGTPYRATCP